MKFFIFIHVYTFSFLACAATPALSDYWVYRESQIFKQALFDLKEQSLATCQSHTPRQLSFIKSSLQAPYLKAMEHWQRLSVFNIENGLPGTYKMSFHFFPDRGARVKKKVKEHLNNSEPIDLKFVEEAIFYSTGLSAYEILLFETEEQFINLASQQLENFCGLLTFIPQNLLSKHLNYEERLKDYLTKSSVEDYQANALNSLISSLEAIKKSKISDAIDFEHERIRVVRLESRRSQKALENIKDNLEAQKEIFDEVFSTLLIEGDFEPSLDYINLGYSKTANLIEKFTNPLSEITVGDENYESSKKLYNNVSLLIKAFKNKVAVDLEIPIFFNGADGD